MKKFYYLCSGLILSIIIILTGCGKKSVDLTVFETDYGPMVIRFFENDAPKHVESFKTLAGEGYFDGTTFHRVVPGFVIQGGDPNSRDDDRFNDGMGGRAGKFYGIGKEDDPDSWLLPAEFNNRSHIRGTVSMARSMDENSAGSQFFICMDSLPQLNNKYTVFGQIIQGEEVLDSIVSVDTPKKLNPNYHLPDGDNPIDPVQMKVRITTDKELEINIQEGK